jgi:hypothetical protein
MAYITVLNNHIRLLYVGIVKLLICGTILYYKGTFVGIALVNFLVETLKEFWIIHRQGN